mmetsp:Transcript_765/g.2025  ORF Transcript_765/g.2025 Transcript_765/m.2025 type:complete len:277 (+) Transcript_765:548-1378(+)
MTGGGIALSIPSTQTTPLRECRWTRCATARGGSFRDPVFPSGQPSRTTSSLPDTSCAPTRLMSTRSGPTPSSRSGVRRILARFGRVSRPSAGRPRGQLGTSSLWAPFCRSSPESFRLLACSRRLQTHPSPSLASTWAWWLSRLPLYPCGPCPSLALQASSPATPSVKATRAQWLSMGQSPAPPPSTLLSYTTELPVPTSTVRGSFPTTHSSPNWGLTMGVTSLVASSLFSRSSACSPSMPRCRMSSWRPSLLVRAAKCQSTSGLTTRLQPRSWSLA